MRRVKGKLSAIRRNQGGDNFPCPCITGVSTRGRFRLRDAGANGTKVTFRLSYQSPGGLLGLLADRVAARQVGRTLAASLENVRDIVES